MKANRFYSNDKVSFRDILDPYINVKIEEIIDTSNKKQKISTSKNEAKESI